MVRVPTSSTPRCQARRAASTWSTALPPSFHAVRPNARSERPRSRTNGPLRTSRDLSLTRPQTRGVNHRLKIVYIRVPAGWCHPTIRAGRGSRPGWGHPTNREADDRTVGATTQPGAKMCHDRTAKMGPPVSSSPTGSAEKPKTVPPASSEGFQHGVTRQFGVPERSHPSVRTIVGATPKTAAGTVPPFRLSPTGSARKPETLPPVGYVPEQCHPSVCRTLGATPQSWGTEANLRCHPPIRWTAVASSLRASPPRVAPVRPPWSLPGPHPTPLTMLAGDPERKVFRLLKPSSPAR